MIHYLSSFRKLYLWVNIPSILQVLTLASYIRAPWTHLSSSYLVLDLLLDHILIVRDVVVHVILVNLLVLPVLLLEPGASILGLQSVLTLVVGIWATRGRLFKLLLAFHSLGDGFWSTISVVWSPSLVEFSLYGLLVRQIVFIVLTRFRLFSWASAIRDFLVVVDELLVLIIHQIVVYLIWINWVGHWLLLLLNIRFFLVLVNRRHFRLFTDRFRVDSHW